MAQKPSIPKGTRDFSPVEMLRRKYIFSTIERVFQKYGFLPLETPAMENLETLTGKYGEEGDRLIFKILNSGDYLSSAKEKWNEKYGERPVELTKEVLAEIAALVKAKDVSEKALRYDLTVPFARYVVQHQNELAFPFKRYQIQPVWRADRPQKGRYREFYQCDADVIGSKSLLNEVDLLMVMLDVFMLLDLKVMIHINNRKVLKGLVQYFGAEDRMVECITIMDKRDKVGTEGVIAELVKSEFEPDVVKKVADFYARIVPIEEQKGRENHEMLMELFVTNKIEEGIVGMHELSEMFEALAPFVAPGGEAWWTHDLTLARGLDYYTGAIFEVKALEGTLQSSICGGGRYDDLTGIFGLKNMSGVGISFGADRIYDVLLETGKFPAELGGSTKLLFANFGDAEALHCLKLLRTVREAGIPAELYPDQVKMAKQFKYADDKGIAYVAIIGETELKQGIVTVKDMKTGEQKAIKQDELIHEIQKA